MTDPIADILGDYRAFFAGQKDRLRARGIDISPYQLSHLDYILFEDFTHVKFYRYSLRTGSERQGHASFDGFVHVDDWVPRVVRTATRGVDPRRAPKT
jgi:hypothetical protein